MRHLVCQQMIYIVLNVCYKYIINVLPDVVILMS